MSSEEPRSKTLRIRCTKTTYKEFRDLVVDYDFARGELALKTLLRMAEKYPQLFVEQQKEQQRVRWG